MWLPHGESPFCSDHTCSGFVFPTCCYGPLITSAPRRLCLSCLARVMSEGQEETPRYGFPLLSAPPPFDMIDPLLLLRENQALLKLVKLRPLLGAFVHRVIQIRFPQLDVPLDCVEHITSFLRQPV